MGVYSAAGFLFGVAAIAYNNDHLAVAINYTTELSARTWKTDTKGD